MGRDTALTASRTRTCSAKAELLAEHQRRRRAEKRAHMLAVRALAPVQANLTRKLRVGLAPERLRAGEEALYAAHPHLSPARDGEQVRAYLTITHVVQESWRWVMSVGVLARATPSGRVTWRLGIVAPLLKLEARRLELARELLLSPRSQLDAGVPGAGTREGTEAQTVLSGDTATYVRELRALREGALAGAGGEPDAPEAAGNGRARREGISVRQRVSAAGRAPKAPENGQARREGRQAGDLVPGDPDAGTGKARRRRRRGG